MCYFSRGALADNVSVAEVLAGTSKHETVLRVQLVAAAEKLPASSYDPEDL